MKKQKLYYAEKKFLEKKGKAKFLNIIKILKNKSEKQREAGI